MDALTWAIIVVAVLAVIALAFTLIRHRQRDGKVLASRTVAGKGKSS